MDGRTKARVFCTPDTGATRTIISLSVLLRNRFHFRRSVATPLLAANNSPLQCEGEIKLTFTTLDQSKSVIVDALVVENLSSDVLVSWHDLQALGIISQSFPAALPPHVRSVHQIENDSLDRIKSDFSDVLGDKLKEEAMTGPLMHIDLEPGAKPTRISTARAVPLRIEVVLRVQ